MVDLGVANIWKTNENLKIGLDTFLTLTFLCIMSRSSCDTLSLWKFSVSL